MRKMPDLVLERYLLGELPPARMAAVERQLAEDEDARARLAALERSNREVLEAHPPGPTVAAIRRRAVGSGARAGRRWSLWIGLPAAATAAAAAAVLLLSLGPIGLRNVPPPEIVIVKGGARLKVYRQGRPGVLLPGSVVAEGDALMVHYFVQPSAETNHGAILSLDGRGRVSLHFPADEGGSTALERGRDVALEHSFELDDAPRFERFFLVTSAGPIDVGAVRAALRALGASETASPRLPAGVVIQSELLLRKGRSTEVTP